MNETRANFNSRMNIRKKSMQQKIIWFAEIISERSVFIQSLRIYFISYPSSNSYTSLPQTGSIDFTLEIRMLLDVYL